MSSRNEDWDYGSRIAHDSQWKGPLEVERQLNDFPFFVVYVFYLAIWIGIGVFAFCTSNPKWISELESGLDIPHSAHSRILYSILGFTVLGIILSFAYLLLLRYFPNAVVFTELFLLVFMLLAPVIPCAYTIANDPKQKSAALPLLVIYDAAITVLIVLVLVFRKQITMACGVIQESTKAVIFFPSSFLFPVLPFILVLMSFAYIPLVGIYLFGDPSPQSENTNIFVFIFLIIVFLGTLWTMLLMCAFSKMVLTGTFASWYWAVDKNRIPYCTMLKIMYITIRYHLGTLAFGPLMTIISPRDTMLCPPRDPSQNSIYGGARIFGFSQAMHGGILANVRWVNYNAYIMCIMHGTEFMQSVKDALFLMMRNVKTVNAIRTATGIVLLLGGIFVIFFSSVGAYAYCRNMEPDVSMSIVLLVTFLTMGISTVFCIVLSCAIDTIFLCALEDYERNDGSSAKPYVMSAELKELLFRGT